MNSADRIEAFNFIVVPPLRILTFVWLRCSKARFQSLNILLHNVCAKWQIPKTVITPAWQFWWKLNEKVFDCTTYLMTLIWIGYTSKQETLFWTSISCPTPFTKSSKIWPGFFKGRPNKEEKDAGIGMDGLIPQVDMLDSKSLHGGWPCFGIFHAASQLRPPSLSKAKVAAKLPIFSTQAGRQKSLVDPITLLVLTLWKTNSIERWKFQIFICGTKYSVDVFLLHLDFSFYIHICYYILKIL